MAESGIWRLIAGRHGGEAADTLCRLFGGRQVWVPSRPNDTHPIARQVSAAVLATLVEEAGGLSVYIPLGPVTQEAQVRAAILALLAAGWETRAIARRLGVAEQTVRRLRRDGGGR